MKKVKIMLLSFAFVAVLGGALAFNTKNYNSYCTAPTNSSGASCPTTKSCPTLINNAKIVATGTFICTADTIAGSCDGVLCAGTSARIATKL